MGTADSDKKDVISESIRQLEDIKTYFELTEGTVKNIIPEVQIKLKRIVESHMYKGNCTKKRGRFSYVQNVYTRYSTFLYYSENP